LRAATFTFAAGEAFARVLDKRQQNQTLHPPAAYGYLPATGMIGRGSGKLNVETMTMDVCVALIGILSLIK
jgi:hypothetical protein